MNATPALRRYTLTPQLEAGRLRVSVARSGPAQPMALAHGRPVADALRLAPAVFSLCPHAHRAAAHRALHDAGGVEPTAGVEATHDVLSVSEALSAAAFRMGVAWPRLLGGPPLADAVKPALQAAAALAGHVASGAWRALRRDGAVLAASVRRLAAQSEPVCAQAARFSLHSGSAMMALGAALHDPALTPDDAAREETPRSQSGPAATQTLAPWYEAQIAHARDLADGLDELCATCDLTTPTAPLSALSTQSQMTGLGMAMTARGRLRHVVRIAEGRVVDWRVAAPTDWNLARHGALAHSAMRLDLPNREPETLTEALHWLAGAFDPCAPYDIAALHRPSSHQTPEAIHA